ncbi:9291_t:CDS:2 [Ambispora gerdemannii]|uniref:9291_t:CDS:1 n=1 Tax=Ambispora gerdemannii TaxID=144530 RepID=A0A9N8V849_9GLOM|nr:9291_t:CDS:2 [Ambispora gerdemannii]
MSGLYFPTRSFQIYQTFAANTNLGKTLFSAGLLRVAATDKKASRLFYLKPVQTGYPVDSDARFVDKFVNSKILNTKTLYCYEKPVSPHIATDKPPNDKDVLSRVKSFISECQIQSGSNGEGKLILETAGGVNSPLMSGTAQCDFYRPLRLPTILIGDSKLGGISTTISSFEALRLRGYDIPAILLFHDSEYNNFQYLREYFRNYDTRIHAISPPPPKNNTAETDHENLRDYFSSTAQDFQNILKQLNEWHHIRFDRLESMEKKTMKKIWWPFTQHQRVKNVTIIDSAHSDFLTTFNKNNDNEDVGQAQMKEMFDACASWWTQGLGHGSAKLSLAASYAAGRYGHVIFPECTHEPALDLAEKLLEGVGKDWATRVFYSDNGSTAVEVALKMALKTNLERNNIRDENSIKQTGKEFLVFGIEGSYHGDTIGAMDACGPNVYNDKVKWYKPRGYWFEAPTVHIKNGMYSIDIPKSIHPDNTKMTYFFPSLDSIFNQDQLTTSDLVKIYEEHIRRILSSFIGSSEYQFGALILEPILMGAGGMKLVDPLFQRVLIDEVRRNKIPVIFDEVFTGFWRLGYRSGADLLGKKPDIATYAKLITGGLIPLAVTLTTESIFENFIGSEKTDALLHGHSYTAHPTGCFVAKTSLDEYERLNKNSLHWNLAKSQWADHEKSSTASSYKEPIVWSFWDKKIVHRISHLPNVKGVVTLGYASNASQSIVNELYSSFTSNNFGIYARPLGNVVYLMTSHVTLPDNIRAVEEKLVECIKSSK